MQKLNILDHIKQNVNLNPRQTKTQLFTIEVN